MNGMVVRSKMEPEFKRLLCPNCSSRIRFYNTLASNIEFSCGSVYDLYERGEPELREKPALITKLCCVQRNLIKTETQLVQLQYHFNRLVKRVKQLEDVHENLR
jgi:hypothetical protein